MGKVIVSVEEVKEGGGCGALLFWVVVIFAAVAVFGGGK